MSTDAMETPSSALLPRRRSLDATHPSTPPSAGKLRHALRGSPGGSSAAIDAAAVPRPSRDDAAARADLSSERFSADNVSESSDGGDRADVPDVAAVAREGAPASSPENDSLALARMLQEQERAYYLMQFPDADPAAHPPGDSFDDAHMADAADDVGGAVEDIHRLDGTHDGTPASDPEEDESLALARQLMEEEQRAWRDRMLAMAGVRADAEDAEGLDPDAMTYEELTALGEQIGTQSKGLAREIVDALPVRPYVPKEGEDEEEEQCAVCRMEFEAEEAVRCLPACGHVFHVDCLAPWLAENKCCPICKTEIEAA